MTTFCVSSVIVLVVCGLFSSGHAQFDEGTVRLSRGINGHSGYVEIYHDHQWGRVCDTDWDDVDAGVVCIQLGYIGGNLPAADFSDPPDTGLPIVLDEVNCLGDETVLIECNKGDWDHFETGCMTATVECIPHETTMSMAVLTTEETIVPVATTKQPQMPTMQSTQSPLPGISDNTVTYVVISVLSVALVVTIAAIIVYAVRKRMKRGRGQRNSPGISSPEYMNSADSEGTRAATELGVYEDVGLPSWAAKWEIAWSNLVVEDRVLGRGDFGEVRAGAVKKGGKTTKSAIKILKGQASAEEKLAFMEEFRTMSSIGYHPNVVSLLGACQHHDVLFVALEYLPNGDLQTYLRKARSESVTAKRALTSERMVKFAFDVAKGMKHLAISGVIHRDLAARNVLLGEGLVAKVSDFGLSRGEDIYVQTSRGMVPTRWLAIESLMHQTYTTQSDVWAFGILLWEIATLGGTPYPSIESKALAGKLKGGYRMAKPSNCDDEMYALMLRCWNEDPNKRPSFADLIIILGKMTNNHVNHTYFVLDGPRHYDNLCAILPELEGN